MKYEFDVKGASELVKRLEALPSELVSKRGGPVRLALRKAAMIIRDEESRRFRGLESGDPQNQGLLDRSIIARRARPPFGTFGEAYIVTFRRLIYIKSIAARIKNLGGHKKIDEVTTRKTAQLFEWGSSHQPPRKFILPSFHAKAGEAMDMIISDLKRRIDIIDKKQSRGAK